MPYLVQSQLSVIGAFLFLTIPLLILFYLAFLLFIRPPKKILLTSLAAGIVVAVVNLLVDLLAYYAHWWHYDTRSLNELILHLPLPFYVSPWLIFGSLPYLLIWRFWHGRLHWLSLVLLIGVPLFCIIRDIEGGLANTSYQVWDNSPAAVIATILLWTVGFYAGFLLFWHSASRIVPVIPEALASSSQADISDEAQHHVQK